MSKIVRTRTAMVVDAMLLRGAGIGALLEPWAHTMEMDIFTTTPDGMSLHLEDVGTPNFVIFSVGGSSLRDPNTAQCARDIRERLADTPCLIMSDHLEPEEAILAARLGVSAFMSTNVDPSMALQALAFVIGGGTYFPREALLQSSAAPGGEYRIQVRVTGDSGHLTRRQNEVLERLRLGRSNKHIGRDLDMRESTVKVHVRQIMRKLGAANRTQAALLAGGTPAAEIAANANGIVPGLEATAPVRVHHPWLQSVHPLPPTIEPNAI